MDNTVYKSTNINTRHRKNIMKKISSRTVNIAAVALIVTGVISSPIIASAASNTANTIINASVGSAISIASGSTVSMALTPTTGGVVSSSSDTVTVNTNNATGYTLTLANSDANVNLTSGSNTIGANSSTQASPAILSANRWGYAVAGVGGFDATYTPESSNVSSVSKWAGVPATGSPVQLKATSGVANNDTTTVWYGVKATASQPGGTYSDTVTYTATTN